MSRPNLLCDNDRKETLKREQGNSVAALPSVTAREPQHPRGCVVIAAHPACLRNPVHFARNAEVLFTGAQSDSLVCQGIQGTMWEWSEDGGAVFTAKSEELDLERMEETYEPLVYSVADDVILLEPKVPLLRLENTFKAAPRKTMQRARAKIVRPGTQRVDCRLLPLAFWMDVCVKVIKRRQQDAWIPSSV